MHPRFGADHREFVTQALPNCVDQRCSSMYIEHAHSANVPREMSLADEIRQRRLI